MYKIYPHQNGYNARGFHESGRLGKVVLRLLFLKARAVAQPLSLEMRKLPLVPP